MAQYRIQVGKSTVETDVASVEIGTHSSCAVRVEDRVASPHHARITRVASGFELEDLGTATGTWRNGVEVRGRVPLTAGDAIVAGCSRITVALGAGGATLEIAVDPKSFFFEPSSSHKDEQGVLKVGGDSERLVKDEVLFGRFGGLGRLNQAALAVAVLLLLALAFPASRGVALDPGPLATAHARLFQSSAPAGAPAWLAAHHEVASTQGCSACHDTFGGTPPEKCAACHAALITENHPFYLDRSATAATVGIVLDEDVCASCHMDHSGSTPPDGTFLPDPAGLAATCVRCHANGAPAVESITRKPERFDAVPHELVYDRFPHSAHAGQRCDICHVRDADSARVGRDFGQVAFRRCMDCHSADETPNPANAWARDPALADFAAQVKPQHRVQLQWHGSGAQSEGGASRCLDCHADVHAAELRRSKVEEPESVLFALKRRAHAELFTDGTRVADTRGRERGCVECHASGDPLQAGEVIDGRFWHEVHMSGVRPTGDATSAALSETCAQCHTELASSRGLASSEPYAGPPLDSCAACHHEERGGRREALVLAARVEGASQPRERIDFPHAPHVRAPGPGDGSLAAGCFACHSFEAGERGFESVPTTRSDAASCLSCHDDHRHVGGPGATGCALCHPNDAAGAADPVWFGRRATRMRPDTPGFSHWSRGHAQDTQAQACDSCHAGVESARTIAEVPIPSEAEDACFTCHVRDRFHWRGAPTAKGAAGR